VKNLTGKVIEIEIEREATTRELMQKISERELIQSQHIVNLVCNGKKLPLELTLKENNIESGSLIYYVQQERIGDFGIGNNPGAYILETLEDNYTPTQEEVSNLVRDVYKLHGYDPDQAEQGSDEPPYTLIPNLLSSPQREELVSYLNKKYNGENDLKFKLTTDELISLIGQPAFEKMKEVYGSTVDEIWLRRAQMDGLEHQGINWHVDHSTRTMQVALNGDSEYKGGKLVFAYKGKILEPKRLPGTATIHDHKLVHGVTPLKSGPRFGLFFLHLQSR